MSPDMYASTELPLESKMPPGKTTVAYLPSADHVAGYEVPFTYTITFARSVEEIEPDCRNRIE